MNAAKKETENLQKHGKTCIFAKLMQIYYDIKIFLSRNDEKKHKPQYFHWNSSCFLRCTVLLEQTEVSNRQIKDFGRIGRREWYHT